MLKSKNAKGEYTGISCQLVVLCPIGQSVTLCPIGQSVTLCPIGFSIHESMLLLGGADFP